MSDAFEVEREPFDGGRKVLLALLELGSANISELMEKTGMTRGAVRNQAKLLLKYGLITHEKMRGEHILTITEKGKKVAQLLEQVMSILREEK